MIYVEDGTIKVGGVVLPGLVKSIQITETAKIDEQEVEGSAVKPKQAVGYEDAVVKVELIVDDTETATKYQRLAALRSVFRTSGQSVPKPIDIVNSLTAAHGIDRVLFKSLDNKEESKKGYLVVTLEFLQYVSQTVKTTKATSTASYSGGSSSRSRSSGNSSSGSSSSSSSSSGSGLSSSYKDYVNNKRGKSPITDR